MSDEYSEREIKMLGRQNQLCLTIDLAARQSALDNETIYNLRAEIDGYDKICTQVRNELTAAGIPELTEDRLCVVPLAKRVALLATSSAKLENDNKKLRDIVIDFNDAFEHYLFGVLPNGNESCGYDEGKVRGGELLNRLHDRSLPFLMER